MPQTFDSFSRAYKKALRQYMDDAAVRLARGGAGTMEAYTHQVGQVLGMENALKIFTELIRTYAEIADDD